MDSLSTSFGGGFHPRMGVGRAACSSVLHLPHSWSIALVLQYTRTKIHRRWVPSIDLALPSPLLGGSERGSRQRFVEATHA